MKRIVFDNKKCLLVYIGYFVIKCKDTHNVVLQLSQYNHRRKQVIKILLPHTQNLFKKKVDASI